MMIRASIDQLLFVGSAGFAALSLALPFPLLGTHQDRADERSFQQSIIDQVKTIDTQEEGPALAYPPALTASAQQDTQFGTRAPQPVVEKKLSESEQLKNSPEIDDLAEDEVQIPSFAESILAMPSNIALLRGDESRRERSQPKQAVASSLLAEAKHLKNSNLDITATEEMPAEVVEAPPAKEPVIGVAQRVEVQSIGIDIAVLPGAYDANTQSWTVDDSSAFHANTTVPVNDTNGATLIYGHAKWGIFGNLPDVQPGAEAVVYSADGLRFIYVFESVRQVDPADVSMLTAEGEPRLLLQTCSGLLDQHRTLAVFALKEIIRG